MTRLRIAAATALIVTMFASSRNAGVGVGASSPAAQDGAPTAVQVQYLEFVTKDVNATCAALAAMHGVAFSDPDAALGNARTAPLAGGGMLGVRAPLRETETPIVRPYLLVDDIKIALKHAETTGGQIAMTATELPGHGTFAIYVQGGVEHGLWEK